MTDHSGRSIEYLRISITDRCNLRCRYCMPADGVPSLEHRDILRYEEILRAVGILTGLGIPAEEIAIKTANKDELERYRLSNNSALAFIHDCCAVEPGAECSIADLRTQYETYCSKCGVGAFSSRKFNEDMELHYPQVQRGQDTTGNRRIWKGLRFVGQVD